ncbi:MAG TPA: T9SS type A sorting domain-containing protein [Candidatus Kapabacteria bacterium]|nr:T9SS type A sorting domain-containing protein [Candidatus Kapabacteria bacterium]
MTRLRFLVILAAWAGASSPAVPAYAQSNTPFQNPSLDSNCYFPQIGVPGEIDTIYGSYSGYDSPSGGIGAYIHNLGPKADGTFGNMLIFNGLGPTSPFEIWQEAPTGPAFNLHDLKATARHFSTDVGNLFFGHFHDRTHLDIFDEDAWRIYWADDNGNYDSSRYTDLKANIYGSEGFGHTDVISEPYIAHLTTDTVDDIVEGFYSLDSLQTKDSVYLALFQGGSTIYQKKVAYEDTSKVMPPPYPNDYHYTIQGDLRGTGRDDLLISDYHSNLFFFKNDPPFSLEKFLHAMLYDTLWARVDNKEWRDINAAWINRFTSITMPFLPKKTGDLSIDFAASIPTSNDSNNGIFIFRGGPDFGSHRITIDSAAYVITKPQLGYPLWPEVLNDAGDMTGTGNHLLFTYGWDAGYGWQNYYLTGQALDNKIDIYYSGIVTLGDTLTANADSLEDNLLGNDSYSNPGDSVGHGTMWLMYGSKQIPVHLNPQFADEVNIPQENGAGISFSPNPVIRGWSVATILWPVSEDGEYSIYDMLGRMVEHGPIRLYGGAEEQRIYFSGMPQGVYIYTIEAAHGSASARIVKLGGASGSTGASQPSIIQQMKDARDGRTNPVGLSSPSEIVR